MIEDELAAPLEQIEETCLGIYKTRFASPARLPVTDVWSTICQSKRADVDRRRMDCEVVTQAPGRAVGSDWALRRIEVRGCRGPGALAARPGTCPD